MAAVHGRLPESSQPIMGHLLRHGAASSAAGTHKSPLAAARDAPEAVVPSLSPSSHQPQPFPRRSTMTGRPFESCTPNQIRTIQQFFYDTFPQAASRISVDSVDTLPRDPHKA